MRVDAVTLGLDLDLTPGLGPGRDRDRDQEAGPTRVVRRQCVDGCVALAVGVVVPGRGRDRGGRGRGLHHVYMVGR